MRLRRSRRTLIDLVQADINRTDDLGPDWPAEVLVACFRQNLEWLPSYRPGEAAEHQPSEAAQQR